MDRLDPKQIVQAYLDAIAERDFERARRLLADECFSQRSPIASYDSADAYVADITRVGAILERIERRRMFVDGEDVCVVVNYVTRMDRRQVTPVVHWMRVEQGRISSIESFFDARGYDEMYADS